MEDLDPTTVPNAAAIHYANEYFCLKQAPKVLDDELGDEWDNFLLDPLAGSAYFDIFGINPDEYLNPDAHIPHDRTRYIGEVTGWGRSENHFRKVNQSTPDEMAAIAQFTGARIPATPAEAAGGRANRGGYYPNQPAKGKGAGRSNPYPQGGSRSSGSSWWSSSSNWWSGWGGGSWWQ